MTRAERALLIVVAKAVYFVISYLWCRRESPAMSAVNYQRRSLEDALSNLGESP